MYQAPDAPQPIGGVLDSGFSLFAASLKDSFGLVLVASLLSAPFSRAAQSPGTEIGTGTALTFALAGLVVLALSVVLYAAVIARIHAVSEGRRLPLSEALAVGWRRGPAFFVTGVLFALITFVGFLLLIVPGIYAMVVLLFCYAAAVVDGKGPVASLQYSRELVRGHWWRTALLITVIGIVIGVLYFLLALVAGLAGLMNAENFDGTLPWYIDYILSPLIAAVLGPLGYALYIAVYNDLKLRREGADIAERIAAAEA